MSGNKPKPPVQLGLFAEPAAEPAASVKALTKDEIEFWMKHIPTIEEIDSTPELLAEYQRLAARGKGKGPSEEDF